MLALFVLAAALACGGAVGAAPDDGTAMDVAEGVHATDPSTPDTDETGAPEATIFPTDRVVTVVVELPATSWQAMIGDPEAEQYFEAAIVFDGTRLDRIAIRTKGNSSLNFLKQSGSHRFSFKVDVNEYVADQELRGEKKFVMNNGFKDPTLIREHLAYAVVRDAGLPAPRTAFVDLTVAGEHLGLYTLVEAVDGGFYDEWFADGNGDAYKPEPPAGNLAYRGADFASYPGMEPDRNEDTTDHAALLAMVDALNHGDEAAIAAALDLDAVARYLATSVVLTNLDSYLGMAHNYYLYEEGGVFSLIPWDLNEAFGTFTCGCDRDGLIHLRIDDPTCGAAADRPLVARLVALPSFVESYHGRLRDLIDGPFSPSMMQERIDRAADLVRPFVQSDTTKFFTSAEFEKGLATDVAGKQGLSIGLAAFVSERSAAVRAQLDGTESATNGGAGSCKGGGTPGGKCGDGVCDAAEKANPQLCPKDCQ
jgi:hypothetical protein